MNPIPLMLVRQTPEGWLLECADWNEPLGPWTSKAEAEGHRVALSRTYRHWEDRNWVTTDPPRDRKPKQQRLLVA